MSIIDFPIQLQNKVFSFSAVCKTTWKTLILLKCIVLELTTLKSLLPYEGALWGNYRKGYMTVIRNNYQRKRVRSKLIWLYPKFAQLTYRIPNFHTTKYAVILPEYTSSPPILVWLVLPNFCPFYFGNCIVCPSSIYLWVFSTSFGKFPFWSEWEPTSCPPCYYIN